jgi:hypothetical protein
MSAFLPAVLGAAVSLCLLGACSSLGGKPLPGASIISELASKERLGIAAGVSHLGANEHALRRTGGSLSEPIDLEGVSHLVAILSAAPDAASRYAVTAASLAAMSRRIWMEEIGPGRAREIEDPAVSLTAPEDLMRDLAARHGVDAILVLEPSVYAEVGYVTEQDSASPFGRDIPVGNWLLRVLVAHELALFDAETGRCAGRVAAPRFDGEICLFDLGPMTPRQLMAFLGTEEYAALFTQALRRAVLHLFSRGARGSSAYHAPRERPPRLPAAAR